MQYQYRDRRRKKREMRSLWIQRINAGSKEHGVSCVLQAKVHIQTLQVACKQCITLVQVSYSRLIHGLQQQNINLNRKMLSELAINEPHSFKALVEQVRYMRGDQQAMQRTI